MSYLILKAINFALVTHDRQLRKGTVMPYLFHPIEVGMIISQHTSDEDLICAGILHDTVEDAGVPLDLLRRTFNENIAQLVHEESEDKTKSWKERKQKQIDFFSCKATEAIKIVACADKLSNIRSIERDYQKIGEACFNRFNAGYHDQKWYYHNMVKALSAINTTDMYKELKERVENVFGAIE